MGILITVISNFGVGDRRGTADLEAEKASEVMANGHRPHHSFTSTFHFAIADLLKTSTHIRILAFKPFKSPTLKLQGRNLI